MASIDTEFKADLARIEMRFYDLAKLANTLDECFNDIGGVQKRIKISLLGDTASEAEKKVYNYSSDLQDARDDINTYKGYVRDLYDSLTSVKSELDSILADAQNGQLDISGFKITEPEKPGEDSDDKSDSDYKNKKELFNSLKNRSKDIRTTESQAHASFQANCKLVLRGTIDPLAEYYESEISVKIGGSPSVLKRAIDEVQPDIPDDVDSHPNIANATKGFGLTEKAVSIADEVFGFIPGGGVAKTLLKGAGKLSGVLDIGVNVLQGIDAFSAGYQEQYSMASENPENSPLERTLQATLRGTWETGPHVLNVAAGVGGEALSPFGSLLLGTVTEQEGKPLLDSAEGVVESGINSIGIPDWLDWTD